jgi:hypothetical protein
MSGPEQELTEIQRDAAFMLLGSAIYLKQPLHCMKKRNHSYHSDVPSDVFGNQVFFDGVPSAASLLSVHQKPEACPHENLINYERKLGLPNSRF